jgi:sugar-specific transcriptional regulator TrmB
MDQDLLDLLKKAGLRNRQAKVYLALLLLGNGTVSQIAAKTDYKRPIIYVILEELISKGYVIKLKSRKINTYNASKPTEILNDLKNTTKDFSEMMPYFLSFIKKGEKQPKIEFITKKERIWRIYENVIYDKNHYVITSYLNLEYCFNKSLIDWIELNKNKVKKLNSKQLISNNPKDIEVGQAFQKYNQQIRILKDIKSIDFDIIFSQDKMIITSIKKEFFAVSLESKQLVETFKLLFEIIWKSSLKLK